MNQNSNSLHLALKEPSMEKRKNKVKQLIANGADLNERNEQFETPLHVAISLGLDEIAAELIPKMRLGCNYLHLAIRMDRPQIIELMIKFGFNINAKCNIGFTHLHYAIRFGTEIIVKILLENGADFDTKFLQLGLTPLMVAIIFNRSSIVKILIEHGASLKKRNIKGMSPLEIALVQKKFDIAKIIQHYERK